MTIADIDDDQKRRPAFLGGQCARVLLGLTARTQHCIVEALGMCGRLEFLRFENESATPIQIDAPGGRAAVAVRERDRALEHVLLFDIRVRRFHTQ